MKKLIICCITLLVLVAGCGGSSSKGPSLSIPSIPSSPSNPILVVAQPGPNFFAGNGHIGKEAMYIKVTGVTTACTVNLTGMDESVGLVGYPDTTFTAGAVVSTNPSGFDRRIVSLNPNSSNEMFIKIDASSTEDGTNFTLTLNDT